jgi:hypothetical protein
VILSDGRQISEALPGYISEGSSRRDSFDRLLEALRAELDETKYRDVEMQDILVMKGGVVIRMFLFIRLESPIGSDSKGCSGWRGSFYRSENKNRENSSAFGGGRRPISPGDRSYGWA